MRRSLVETLGSMPSADQNNSLSNAQSSLTAGGAPDAKKLKLDSCGESTPMEFTNSGNCYINEKVDDFIIKELQRELDQWAKLLHKSRNMENDMDFNEIVKSPIVPAKHHLRNQQIDELEINCSRALGVVGAFLERVDVLKAKHNQNIMNISQRLHQTRLEKFASTDPKALIKQLFEIHEKSEQ